MYALQIITMNVFVPLISYKSIFAYYSLPYWIVIGLKFEIVRDGDKDWEKQNE